jgi:alpha-1,3-mannosyltransferase
VNARIAAFDLRSATGRPTGVGKYLLSIATAAAELPNVKVRAYIAGGDLQLGPSIEVIVIRRRGLLWHLAVWRHLRRHPVTAYVSTSLIIPSLPGVPARPVVLDVSSFRVPQHQTRRTKLFERALLGRVIRRHPLIFGARAAADDVQDLFPEARGVVVPPWFPQPPTSQPATEESLAGIGVSGPYVLMVGTVEPRKNVLMAARVVAQLRASGRDLKLVVVGRRGWVSDHYVTSLRELEAQSTVAWPGYVTDDQRDALYAGASALLLPSVYEGFGMPIVEAMAIGLPCLCSSIPVFDEVAGDAAIRLDPAKPDAWVAALDELLDSPKQAEMLSAAGLARAAMYSPARTAHAFEQALGGVAAAQSAPPVRVLHICRRYLPFVGGTEKYVHDLAFAQAATGREVTILTLDRDVAGPTKGLPGREKMDGLAVVRVPGRGIPQFATSYRPDRIWREIARHDVVHIHDLRFALASTVIGAVFARRPRILHTHGLIFHSGGGLQLKRLAMRLYFGPLLRLGGVRIVASSETDMALLLRDAPYLASRTVTCPNAIPLAPLLGLRRDPVAGRVVSIGRIVPNKALVDLIRALARLEDVEWSLVLAGEPDRAELARLEAVIDELRVHDRVTFVLGFPEAELPRLLASAALAAFPSKGEGFGIALLEAMAAGVPLLANAIPAHEALLGEELADQLIDFGDTEAAAKSIGAMLKASQAELDGLSIRLRARAAGYDIARLTEQIDQLYGQLGVRPRCR